MKVYTLFPFRFVTVESKSDSFRMAAQFTVYKKQEEELDEYSSSSKGGAKKNKGRSPTVPTVTASLPPKEEEPSFFPKKEPKKGQDKFVPLFSKEGREAEVVCVCKFDFLTCDSGGQASRPAPM